MRGRADFRRVYREGRRGRAGPVTVVAAAGRAGHVRVGVVAGRRVGSAVRRNRAKRRLREAARRVGFREGTDYVLIASPRVVNEDFGGLVAHLAEAVRRAEESG